MPQGIVSSTLTASAPVHLSYNQPMEATKSILFVCTGNVFRSVAAQLCFKKYLSDNGITGWDVGSAGIFAEPEHVDPKVLETLQELGIPHVKYQQRRLTKEILDGYDAI